MGADGDGRTCLTLMLRTLGGTLSERLSKSVDVNTDTDGDLVKPPVMDDRVVLHTAGPRLGVANPVAGPGIADENLD